MSTKPPRVVAELGRPETAAETAARKAENSRLYRSRKTINNLVLSLLACLAAVVIIVLAVPRGNYTAERDVDYVQVAADSQPSIEQTLIVPELPDGWKANIAELRHSSADDVTSWYVGWVTPEENFAALSQGFNANENWVATQLERSLATGTEQIGGFTWTVYDHRDSRDDTGNVDYALTTVAQDSSYVVYGTAPLEDIHLLAQSVADHIAQQEG
ncbi:hypothetical protein GCM10022198_17500 [Klugiella xanthotipulae]|uniref:Uncharacterized protein DUF4245 n=1 Tax=Klugiella xanthotipulae TaxID=244735 RepID=A0A543HXP0_9MICO|nr:DUF4245 domain-containing protein [Klugiella xanthotipulae]TQM63081.1 uncharacterized protein DUF4245 [Klugiella xanthotipulae]